jgi:uncharacterized membrane protein
MAGHAIFMSMQFRLSTLLIVTAALGILFAQYPYVVKHAAYIHPHGPYLLTYRFGWALFIESSFFVGWILARRGRFPWKGLLIASAAINLSGILLWFLVDGSGAADRNRHAAVIGFVLTCFLVVFLSAVFGTYSIIAGIDRLIKRHKKSKGHAAE